MNNSKLIVKKKIYQPRVRVSDGKNLKSTNKNKKKQLKKISYQTRVRVRDNSINRKFNKEFKTIKTYKN